MTVPPDPLLSLVLPARNESSIIEESVRRVTAYLAGLEPRYELIVGDSGSEDDTGDRVRAMGMDRVRVVREDRRGKGRVLTRALLDARGPIVGFLDADLEIPVTTVAPLLESIRDGAHAAIAVKTRESDRHRPRSRRFISRSYNLVVGAALGSRLPDHQAGCKLFWAPALRPELTRIHSTGWLWDTEVLVRLGRRGARIDTFPCRPGPARPSGVRPLSLLSAARDLGGLWLRLRLDGIRGGREPLDPVDPNLRESR